MNMNSINRIIYIKTMGMLLAILLSSFISPSYAWSNGDYSSNPNYPKYGMYDNIHIVPYETTFDAGKYTNVWMDGNYNRANPVVKDVIPPGSITNLKNISYTSNYINWTWTDPKDIDFSKVIIYVDGKFKVNISKGKQYYNLTGLIPNTLYKISTHTIDTLGNINKTWVNRTTRTYYDIVPSGYSLIWSDQFSGPIDNNKWIIWNTSDKYWNPNNVKTENGNLKLIGELNNGNIYTGSIRSNSTFLYGYISIKAKLVKGKGFMSQLWMNSLAPKECNPQPPKWSGTYPEIDLNEMPGDYINTISNTIHWWTNACTEGKEQNVSRPPLDLTKDFHYYGLEWNKDQIKFYFDGKETYSTTNKIYEPMSIVIGLCVAKNNGNCAGSNAYDSSTVFPGIMYVDFVNVYIKNPI